MNPSRTPRLARTCRPAPAPQVQKHAGIGLGKPWVWLSAHRRLSSALQAALRRGLSPDFVLLARPVHAKSVFGYHLRRSSGTPVAPDRLKGRGHLRLTPARGSRSTKSGESANG